MTSNTSAVQAEPALRIPMVDSMKRLSAATEFSDMSDFDFTTSIDDEPLILPTYLLEQIDIGQHKDSGTGSSNESVESGTRHITKLESIPDESQDQVNRASHIDWQNQHTTDHAASASGYPVSVRRSSLTVPFNQSRPLSQLTTRTEGITALPTVPSGGALSNPQCILGSNTPTPTAALGHKRKPSFSFSAPVKRLRRFSITSKFKARTRRSSSLSCMTIDQDEDADKNGKITSSPERLNLSIEQGFPARIPSATACNSDSHTNTNKDSLATTVIPTYSHCCVHSPTHQSAPAEVLLPNDSDLNCLTALQDVIFALNDENEKLKQQVETLREDWYATHDELLLERYNAWEKECELERLKFGMQSEVGTGFGGTHTGMQGARGKDKGDVDVDVRNGNGDERVRKAGNTQVEYENWDLEMFSWAEMEEAVGVAR